MKPLIQLADKERHTGVLPADSAAIELERPTLFLWAILAGLSLILGLAWRLTGNAPAVPQFLDGVGLALWLTAPWLAMAWDRLLRRQSRHVRPLRDPWAWRMANSSYLLFAALLLSLAPTALLLGFSLKEPVGELSFQDDWNMFMPVGAWLMMSLILVGPITVIVSTVLLHLARAIAGWRWGLCSWLILTVAFNAPLVLGEGSLLNLTTEQIRLPLTVGQYAAWTAAQIAKTQAEAVYLHEMIGRLIFLPATALLAALIAATVIQQPTRRLRLRVDAVWLVSFSAIAVVAARAAWQGWLWAGDPARTAPGDWLVLFYSGMAAAWLVWFLLLLLRLDFVATSIWQAIAWLGFTAVGWFSLTLAHRFAGQMETATVLTAEVAALLLLVAGLLALYWAAKLRTWRLVWVRDLILILVWAVLVVPLPLGGRHVPLIFQGFSQLVDDLSVSAPKFGYYVLVGLLVICIAGWPHRTRRRANRSAAAESAGSGQ